MVCKTDEESSMNRRSFFKAAIVALGAASCPSLVLGVFRKSISKAPIEVLPGYLLCDGSAVSKATYSELFAIIGTTFGEGNKGTFRLPDSPTFLIKAKHQGDADALPGFLPIGALLPDYKKRA